MPKGWTCPYCNQIATITASNISSSRHPFGNENSENAELWLNTFVIVCPNHECRQYVIDATLWKTKEDANYIDLRLKAVEPCLQSWRMRPRSKAKPLPGYIPAPIVSDYEEACLIVADSPKASATLARRCLQGIIRDYWGFSMGRLVDEINELKSRLDATTWQAIDSVRSIGNIGAHMEKDINLIIEVDPGEAELLIQLLEILFKEWYVNRHERDQQMKQIIAIAQNKSTQKANLPIADATKAQP